MPEAAEQQSKYLAMKAGVAAAMMAVGLCFAVAIFLSL